MTLYAHSENTKGTRQPLAEHLRNVAALARERARPFGGGDLAFLAGLWHDAGKPSRSGNAHAPLCDTPQELVPPVPGLPGIQRATLVAPFECTSKSK